MKCDKVVYDTIAEAHEAAKQFRTFRRVELKVYRCSECHLYHLTSVKRQKLLPSKKLKYPFMKFIKKDKGGKT